MYCHVKFGSSASKGVEGNPQIWEALGHRPRAIEAWLTPRNTLLRHVLSCQIWSF